jgi:hypothetical protein
MQTPSTAQLGTAIEVLTKLGERLNLHAEHSVVQLSESQLSSYRTITGTTSLFRTQALLLSWLRFLRPRSSRGLDAECPRQCPASWPWSCPVRDHVLSETSPHPRDDRFRAQPVTVSWPCPHPRPQTVRVRGCIEVASAGIHPKSANCPCPRPVRSRAKSMTISCPFSWTVRNRIESSKCPGRGCIASAQRTTHLQTLPAHVRL